MKTLFILTSVMVVLLLCSAGKVEAQEEKKAITNADVVEMSKAGLPATVIISKIKTSKVDFKTELANLKSLTDEKVSELVVSAMIEAQAAQSKAASVVSEQPKDALLIQKPSIPSPPFVTYNELDKDGQKQRLKGPAVVEIAAASSDVIPLLVRSFQSWNYQIESENNRSLMLSKPVTGFGNELLVGMAMGGNNMRYKVQISIAEFQGISSVNVSAWVTSDNAFGKTTQQSLNDSKKWRPELDDLLRLVKNEAERPTISGTTESVKKPSTSISQSVTNPDGFPNRWKSMQSGLIRTLRKDGDYIYFEADLKEEEAQLGLYNRGQVTKQGDVYIGTLTTTPWYWWKINPTTGKKYTEKVCRVDDAITLKIVSPTRIEVDGDQYPKETKFDKACKPNKKKVAMPTAVWIPIEEAKP